MVLAILLLPQAAHAHVLLCYFTPTNCPDEAACEEFDLMLDSHHSADAPYIDYGGVSASVIVVPEENVDAPSYVTVGHVDREIMTIFNGVDALHTRHYTFDGVPMVQSSIGSCYSFD